MAKKPYNGALSHHNLVSPDVESQPYPLSGEKRGKLVGQMGAHL